MKETKRYSILRNVWFLTKDIAKEYPALLVLLVLDMTMAVASPAASLYLPKLAVDLATMQASGEQVMLQLGLLGLVLAAAMALYEMSHQGRYMLYNSMRTVYGSKMFFQSLNCDYNLIDSAEGQKRYNLAYRTIRQGDLSGTSKMITGFTDLAAAILCFTLYSTVLSTLNPWVLLILVLLTSVNFFAVRHAQRYEEQNKEETAKLNRQMSYIQNTADNWRWGKDIRLYAMSGWLLSFLNVLLDAFTALQRKIQRRYFAAGIVNALTLFFRDAAVYGYLIWAVSTGSIDIGSFVLYFGAVTGFSGFVSRIIEDINTLNGANLQMNDMRAFLDNTDAPEPEHPAALPQNKQLSIEFCHVDFSYGTKQVLRDFSLKIDAGEKIALVGVNGAGKTTLVKLLCGLYKPDNGKILIDGVDISNYRKEDLFQLFSPVFQDILILPFTVAENVSMCLEKDTDLSRVSRCLQEVGLGEAVEGFPEGIHSPMLKDIQDGVVLSGGQNQKLMMARALYRDAPILILDEPTAALDPIAESETYEQFHRLSQEKTALYISHRLASTRFCDRIILLKDGVVAESGTHEQLIAQGGEYAYLYEVQSQYYQEKGGAQDA